MMDPELVESFLAETQELLDEIEPQIIEIQEAADSVEVEALNAIFRLFHSMKGSAGFLGLERVARVTHDAETLLDLFRKGKAHIEAQHADTLLRTIDLLRRFLERIEQHGDDQGLEEESAEITAELAATVASLGLESASTEEPEVAIEAEAPPIPEPVAELPVDDGNGALFSLPGDDTGSGADEAPSDTAEAVVINDAMRNSFAQEAEDLLERVEQALLKLGKSEGEEAKDAATESFRSMHSLKGNAGFMGLADLESVAHCFESCLERIKDGELEASEARVSTLLESIDTLREASLSLLDGGDASIQDAAELKERINAAAQDGAGPSAVVVPAEPPRGKSAKAPRETRAPSKAGTQNIRVNLEKLDSLINLVGELVIAEAMVTRHPHVTGSEIESLDRAVHHLRRVSRELQDVAMSVRMIPLAGTFRKMIRLVHDLSRKSSKQIELELLGEDTEVDKTVIEMISDPLVHIVRNSADHGIESSAERVASGKSETGKITIEGRHEGGEVWILIRDDGRGLDRDKILGKAIERGLVDPAAAPDMEDEQVFRLIFEPGFSTAAQVTDISGRGVGMDVVKRNIEKLKGKIDVQSHTGSGTTLILRIPLTLAIIDGMLVRVGAARYTIPMLSIRESFRPAEGQITITPEGQEIVRVREDFFPVLRMHQRFETEPDSAALEEGILVLVETENRGIALLVDEILGQQETVIKGLSGFLGDSRGVSGCTILGDGEVSLILDVPHLLEEQPLAGLVT